MKWKQFPVRLVQLAAVVALAQVATAQSMPAASQQLQLSAFVAATGTYTRLEGGKNLGVTAGADITYLGFRLLRPAVEVRGTYPVNSGHISSQKSFLVGPRVEYPIGRFHPYGDLLFGRGAITYLNGGFIVGPLQYLSSNTFIYSPGAGADYDLNHHVGIKADAQFEHWNTPVVASGSISPVALTGGLVYTFDFNSHHWFD